MFFFSIRKIWISYWYWIVKVIKKSSLTFWQVHCTVARTEHDALVKSTTKNFSNFVAFSENPNFNIYFVYHHLKPILTVQAGMVSNWIILTFSWPISCKPIFRVSNICQFKTHGKSGNNTGQLRIGYTLWTSWTDRNVGFHLFCQTHWF